MRKKNLLARISAPWVAGVTMLHGVAGRTRSCGAELEELLIE